MTRSDRLAEVRIQGRIAGRLEAVSGQNFAFEYFEDYDGPDLSVSMQAGRGPFTGREVFAWFDNLLPDNERIRRGMADGHGYGSGNTFRMLEDYGLDLPGAVQVTRLGHGPDARQARYAPVSEAEIASHLHEILKTERTRWQGDDEHWSLGGAQGKHGIQRAIAQSHARHQDTLSSAGGATGTPLRHEKGTSYGNERLRARRHHGHGLLLHGTVRRPQRGLRPA